MHAPPLDASLPIAVFDSGVGGLTVLHECLVSLPEEDYLYLGDDARFPYGTKDTDELRECVERNTRFLLDRGAKLIVIACNSAAGAGLDAARAIAAGRGVEVIAVIEPEAEIAAAITESGRVGVLATPATVAGGAYRRALSHERRELTVTEVAAPDLAAIIQRGFPFSEGVVETVRSYCAPLKRAAEVDTVILGCTHYPLVRADAAALPRPRGAAGQLRATRWRPPRSGSSKRQRLETANEGEGTYRFLCTGDVDAFRELGTRFLQMPLGDGGAGEMSDRERRRRDYPCAGEPTILEQVQTNTREAMKAGERDRVAALRLVADALQKDAQGGRRRRGRRPASRAQAPPRGGRGLPRRAAATSAPRPRRPRRS